MRRKRQIVALFVAVWTLGGCWWSGPGRGSDRDAYNHLEAGFTADTVDGFVELWSATTDEPGARGLGPPATSKLGLVYVTSTHSVYAFDHSTGAQRWIVTPSSAVYEGVDSDLYAFAERRVEHDDEYVIATLKGSDTHWVPALVYADTGQWFPSVGLVGRIEGVRRSHLVLSEFTEAAAGTIEQRLLLSDLLGSEPVEVLVTAQPDYANRPTLGVSQLFHSGVGVGTAPGNGVRAFAVPSGAAQWTTPIDGTRSTTPVLAPDQDVVYVGTDAGTFYALDTATGAVLWSSDVGSAVTAPPSLAEGTLFVPTASGALVALAADGCGAPSCPSLWSTPAGVALSVQPASAAGVVFTGAADGTVSAFPLAGCGASTCAALWSAGTGSPITGAPAVSFGKVFVGTQDGRLVAYGLPAPAPSEG